MGDSPTSTSGAEDPPAVLPPPIPPPAAAPPEPSIAAPSAVAGPAPKLPFTLQGEEEIILITRRHWLYLWPRLVFHALLGLVLGLLVIWLISATVGIGGMPGKVLLAVTLGWALYWAGRCYFDWYSYHNDIWVVTNQRIVDSIKPNYFRSRLASADLVDIEDITVEHHGLLQTVFRYGDLRCQTAGEQPNFILGGIPHPPTVLGVVDVARDAARRDSRRGWR
jgi:hypothetical protein